MSVKSIDLFTGTLGPVLEDIPYAYGDASWKDKLTSYNGGAITYDEIGNPLSDGTWTYTWQAGRQLASMSKTGATVSFAYNADGLRMRKTVSGVSTTNYFLHGKNIVHMTQGSYGLHFFYDGAGKVSHVKYNGTMYLYVYNLQGDVIAIRDSAGADVVTYKYDAWGKPLSKAGSMADTLGTLNPFRYRGYVYDEETGLYYLRSRYYNPSWKRFISSDIYLGNSLLLEHNVYIYCLNSPIKLKDTNGNAYCECGNEHEMLSGEKGNEMTRVINKNYRKGRMKICHFISLLEQILNEKWQYSHDTAYAEVDCVGIYRYIMYWYYSRESFESLQVYTTVEDTYNKSVFNTSNSGKSVVGKGKLKSDTDYVVGMVLFRNPLGNDGHVAFYVGDSFPGYKNAVIEAVESGVVIRELADSEATNGEFTHYGYLKGLDYGD